jgi:hypothetical protein
MPPLHFSTRYSPLGVVKLKDAPNQLGTEITLIARIALHLSYSDLTTPISKLPTDIEILKSKTNPLNTQSCQTFSWWGVGGQYQIRSYLILMRKTVKIIGKPKKKEAKS